MTVTNQKPVELSPLYTANIKNTFNPVETLKALMATPLFQPQIPTAQVSMTQGTHVIKIGRAHV